MKVRHGFVANSSSTSFCCIGIKLSKEELCSFFNIDKKEIYEYLDDELNMTYKEFEFEPDYDDILYYGISLRAQTDRGESDSTEIEIEQLNKLFDICINEFNKKPTLFLALIAS